MTDLLAQLGEVIDAKVKAECRCRTTDLELLVAEVGYDFQQSADRGDVAVQDIDTGDVTGLDLGHTSSGDTHLGSNLALTQAAPLARARDANVVNSSPASSDPLKPLDEKAGSPANFRA